MDDSESAPRWLAYRREEDWPSEPLGPPIAHTNQQDARAIAVALYGEPVILTPFAVLRLSEPPLAPWEVASQWPSNSPSQD